MSRTLSGVKNAECGVSTKRCLIHASLRRHAAMSGASNRGGSSGSTSSPAANTTSRRSASCSASRSMIGPRAVLMMVMPGLAAAKALASSRFKVSSFNGT